MLPVPEIVRVPEDELNDHVKLSPHVPDASRTLTACATVNSIANADAT